jgi:hypothetical protein
MEQNLRYLLGQSDDDDQNFENFLKDKEKQWKSPLEIPDRITPTPKPADTVVDVSSPESSSTVTGDADLPPLLNDASVAERQAQEHTTLLSIKEKPIVGLDTSERYLSETSIVISVDAEWQKIFVDGRVTAITSMKAEAVIERIHSLDRTIFLIKAQQQGLKLGLEELLAIESASERARLLEMDRKYRSKRSRSAVEVKSKKVSAGTKSAGKSKVIKGIDTLHSLMMSKEGILKKLRDRDELNETTQAYVEKLFA